MRAPFFFSFTTQISGFGLFIWVRSSNVCGFHWPHNIVICEYFACAWLVTHSQTHIFIVRFRLFLPFSSTNNCFRCFCIYFMHFYFLYQKSALKMSVRNVVIWYRLDFVIDIKRWWYDDTYNLKTFQCNEPI